MRRLTIAPAVCALLLFVTTALSAEPTGVRAGYKSPLFTIPYTPVAPPIDGTIDDAVWNKAASFNALQTTEGQLSSRPTRFWMMWDEDHLYIAMRSPLRDGEHVLQATRDPSRDNSKAVFDDSYEIWLNLNTRSPDGEVVFFQYLGNSAGAKYDVMFEPTVGNSRPGWESGWKPKNRITPDGKYWEMTVAIPRQSVYMNQPLADGTQIGGLLVRNFKRPWEQNNLGGSGSFSVPDSHCRFVLSKSAPAIHLLDVADVRSRSLGLHLSALASTAQTLKWMFESDSGVSKSGTLALDGNNPADAAPGLDLDKPGIGFYRIRVTNQDGSATYVDWSSRRAFGDLSATTQPIHDTTDPAELTLSFNPVKSYVRVEGDFINYANRTNIHRFLAEVLDAKGVVLAKQELSLDSLAYVHGLLHLGSCPPGDYIARLTCYDGAGQQMLQKQTPFSKKDAATEYPWWNTKAGNIEKVIAPWTPVVDNNQKIDVWGRSMTVGAAGLPAQISTQGKEILAGPVSLVAETDQGSTTATAGIIRTDSAAENRVTVHSEGKLGGLTTFTETTVEFDGMYKVQLTITPRQPVTVKTLKVVIPIAPEFAEYIHACGEGIRYGFSYGYVPRDKTGVLWDSKQVDGQPMLVGSFIPYVWVGNSTGGLCWFADSDEGWVPNNATPAIELRRDSNKSVDLILNLVSSSTTIDTARTITFAFQATPVKPLREGWRMDTWSTADSFQDFCRVEPKGGHLIWNALPFTLDNDGCRKMVEARHQMDDNYNFGVPGKYHANAVPYFENNGIDKNFAPAVAYFGDQWRARISDSQCYDKTLSDFIIYNLGKWCKECGIDGWYVDNVRPVADDNIDAGRGYLLPDGRVQPSYQMFDTREFFLRVRAVFAENGKSGKFVLHMTNHMIMPWIGAADLALDGEDHVTFPEMNKDFIDFWSPERMRLDYPAQSGVAVTFLQEYQGKWEPADLKRVTRAYTAMCILNDVLPGANPNGQNQDVWRGRDRFGIDAADVKFVPYWSRLSGITCSGDQILASSWRRPGSVLIAVVNRGDAKEADVHLKLGQLGLSEQTSAKVIDADTGEALPALQNGVFKLPVGRHDYRQVIVSQQATP
jgi:hypothetical protein